MRRLLVVGALGTGLAVAGLALAADGSSSFSQKVSPAIRVTPAPAPAPLSVRQSLVASSKDLDASESQLLRNVSSPAVVRGKAQQLGRTLVDRLTLAEADGGSGSGTNSSDNAEALARLLAKELASVGVVVDDAAFVLVLTEGAKAALALAITLNAQIAALDEIKRCEAARDCNVADPSRSGTNAADVASMRERFKSAKERIADLVATEQMRVQQMLEKRQKLINAFSSLMKKMTEAGTVIVSNQR